jgi:hypothetical protein
LKREPTIGVKLVMCIVYDVCVYCIMFIITLQTNQM